MLRNLFAVLLYTLATSSFAATHYIANSGRDSNSGLSPAAPWQTITKLNAALLNARPGDSFMLKRGDVFRDAYVFCGSQYQNKGNQSVASNPPKCSGQPGKPIVIGAYGDGPDPYIDSADVLSGRWTLVGGTTYQLRLAAGEPLPLKLYLDPKAANGFQQQILPVPNYVGVCSPSMTYNFLDMWGAPNGTADISIQTGPNPVTGCSNPSFRRLVPTKNGEARQSFSAGNTGLQNVQAGVTAFTPGMPGFGYPSYPGVWYVSGSPNSGYTIDLNLADGSNPNAHVLEATHRLYGIFIEGTNYVTVQDLTIAHTFESCAQDIPYSDRDAVGGYVTFQRLKVFNCTSLGGDYLTQQNTNSGPHTRGGISIHAGGTRSSPNVEYPAVLSSFVGTLDSYFASDNTDLAGINLNGIDGGKENSCVACGNFVNTSNGPGIVYNASVNSVSGTPPQNTGGRVANNELTNNQLGIGFTATAGGMLDHNYIHDSYGEGMQIGGYSSSTDGGPGGPVAGSQVIANNLIVNLGRSASRSLYNGIDCNTNSTLFSGFYEISNTIVNTWGAGATFEGSGRNGCTAPHFWRNVIDQNYPAFGNQGAVPNWNPNARSLNGGNLLYIVSAYHSGYDFHDNFYRGSPSQKVITRGSAGSFTCQAWLVSGPDRNSICDGTDPLFLNPAANDFRIQSRSPLRATPGNPKDIGAIPYRDPQLPLDRSSIVGPIK